MKIFTVKIEAEDDWDAHEVAQELEEAIREYGLDLEVLEVGRYVEEEFATSENGL